MIGISVRIRKVGLQQYRLDLATLSYKPMYRRVARRTPVGLRTYVDIERKGENNYIGKE